MLIYHINTIYKNYFPGVLRFQTTYLSIMVIMVFLRVDMYCTG